MARRKGVVDAEDGYLEEGALEILAAGSFPIQGGSRMS